MYMHNVEVNADTNKYINMWNLTDQIIFIVFRGEMKRLTPEVTLISEEIRVGVRQDNPALNIAMRADQEVKAEIDRGLNLGQYCSLFELIRHFRLVICCG